jgi:hypothetical protein
VELDESECLCRVGRSGSEAGGLLEAEVFVEDGDEEESEELELDESARLRSVGRSGSPAGGLLEAEVSVEGEEDEVELSLESRTFICGRPLPASVTSWVFLPCFGGRTFLTGAAIGFQAP